MCVAGTSTGRSREVEAESRNTTMMHVLVVIMSRASKLPRHLFLALTVGFFLFVILVNSRQLIDHMKKVCNIGEEIEDKPVVSEVAKKLILKVLKEGGWERVILGVPWQYNCNILVVKGLVAMCDPSMALFTHVEVCIQFRTIPFYFLIKQLVHGLRESTRTTMKIGKYTILCIKDRITRTKVQLPLFWSCRDRSWWLSKTQDKQSEIDIMLVIMKRVSI